MVFFLSIFAASIAALLFVQWLDVEAVNPAAPRNAMKPQSAKANVKAAYAEGPAQAQQA